MILRWVLPIVILLVVPPGYAQDMELEFDVKPLLKLPVGYNYDMDEDGVEEVKCLNTDEWASVQNIAIEYQGLYRWRLKMYAVLAQYGALQTDYENLKSHQEYQLSALKVTLADTRTEMAKKLKSHKVERFLLWSVIVVQGAFIGVGAVKGVD